MRQLGHVRVGSVDYQIIEATPRERKVLRDCYGACIAHKGIILLRAGLAEGVKLETLVHELGHALFYGSGAQSYLKTVLADPDKAEEVEEMLLQILTPMALGVRGSVE